MSEKGDYIQAINILDTGGIHIFTAFDSILFHIIPSD